ncbi:MAG: DUF2662 domain-containing protein [Chloroflexi bacterium]|nr:DUF2662 domain-containing protein [Chloroflexota bacterium]
MKTPFGRLEARLQHFIEEGTARLFSTQDLKSELTSRLAESMHAQVHFDADGQLVAPGTYTIDVSSRLAATLKSNQSLVSSLQAALLSAASDAKIHLDSEPILHIAPNDELAQGEFRVHSTVVGQSLAVTQSLEAQPKVQEVQTPAGAFLIVNGTEIFPLNLPIINIGRKSDNHLAIDDSHISRRHAQLRAIDGHYHFFDLGSTGGSNINGQSSRSAILLPGDVIHLAGVPLIYGQDRATPQEETQELAVAPQNKNNRTRASTKPTP